MDEDCFMELRKGAITEAKKTALKGRLTINDLSIVKLLDVIRKIDWNHNSDGHPVIRPLETTAHSSALLLQERGVKPQSACELCIKTKNKPFQSCVCAPAFRSHALRLGACANCIWHRREAYCSLRTEFVASGGKKWVFSLDLIVLHGGGLLYTEGLGRRLKGLPALRSPRTPAITARKAHPLTESKVESRRDDKSSPSARRSAGTSTGVLGKRPAAPSIEPATKKTRRSGDWDGNLVPWPCTSASWNDPDALKTIYSDLQGRMRAVKRRIEELEVGSRESRGKKWAQLSED